MATATPAQITPPPAIVQTVAEAPKAPQLPIDLLTQMPRAMNGTSLAVCSNFTSPHKGTDLTDPKKVKAGMAQAQRCLTTVATSVQNGTISDAPALALALRGIPFTNAQGNDNVADTASDIATRIAEARSTLVQMDYHLPGMSEQSVIKKPFTEEEIMSVGTYSGKYKQPLPTLTPARSIPIDPSTAYVMTAADVVMHPVRYTDNGKTLAETLARVRKDHPAAEDQKLAQLCMMDTGNTSLQDCQNVSARNTVEMIVNGKAAPYDASQYLSQSFVANVTQPKKTSTAQR